MPKSDDYQQGRQDEHLVHCGWCRQGLECPYKKVKEDK
jgi:hypothetical protein